MPESPSFLRMGALALAATGALSCALVMSFDDYDTSVRYAVRGHVDGLEGPNASVTIKVNGTEKTAENGAFEILRAVAAGNYEIVVSSSGHACTADPSHGSVSAADLAVDVHCGSTDATLVSLSVSDPARLRRPFEQTAINVTYELSAPLIAALAHFPVRLTAITKSPTATMSAGGIAVPSGTPTDVSLDLLGIDLTVTSRAGAGSRNVIKLAPTWPLTIKAPNPQPGTGFGESVALSEDTLVVGASQEMQGAVYVYRRTNAGWQQDARLTASNAAPDNHFGGSVAIHGDTIVVGAKYEASAATGVDSNQTQEPLASQSGAAYVFRRSRASWSQEAYLKASNTAAYAHFGTSVALDGDTVVVGAPGESGKATGVNGNQTSDPASGEAGAAYVFRRSGATWNQEAYLKASNTAANVNFGTSVALDADGVIVGAPGETGKATGVNGDQTQDAWLAAGAAYVFRRSGAIWTQEAYLKPSNTRQFIRFGAAVAFSKDTVAVGAPGESGASAGVNGNQSDDPLFAAAGAAYAFRRSGTTWSQEAYLKASNPKQVAFFGSTLALVGDTLIVGGPNESGGATGINGDTANQSVSQAGAAYVLRRNDTTWNVLGYVKGPRAESDAHFGGAVALARDMTMAISAAPFGTGAAVYFF